MFGHYTLVHGRVTLAAISESVLDRFVAQHELIHALGFGHACHAPTIMNGCPASYERLQYPENADNTSATVYDIAYIQLHRALHDRTVELTPEFGVCEAIEGERTMLEKPRLPGGWPADVTSLQSLRGRDEAARGRSWMRRGALVSSRLPCCGPRRGTALHAGSPLRPFQRPGRDAILVSVDAETRPTPSALDRAIVALAARQHGLVSRHQLVGAGLLGHRIDHRITTGALTLVHRGVYRVGPLTAIRQAEMAAVLACGGHAYPAAAHRVAIARWTAAAIWLLSPPRQGPIQLVVAGCAGRRRPGLDVQHVPSLPADAVALIDGIPVTAPWRTLVDLAAVASAHELERTFALALRLELVTVDLMRAAIAERAGHRGTAMLRALVEQETDPAFTRSEAEQLLLRLIRKARLPDPEVNAVVERIEVDFLWHEQHVVIEVDGFAFHRSRRAFERDRDRDGVLTNAGFRVIRLTWRHIEREPMVAVARIASALGR